MPFLIQVFFTGLLSYILQQFFTAWIVVPVALFISFIMINSTPFAKFLGGFAAISLLWMWKATVIDIYTNAILSSKIATMLGLKSVVILILVTGLVGGILGGLGAATGQCLRNILFTKPHKKPFRI